MATHVHKMTYQSHLLSKCLAESFIKCLKLIARFSILNLNLPFTIWGHDIIHTTTLIQIQPYA